MNIAISIIPFEYFHLRAKFSEIEIPQTKGNLETNAEKRRKLYLSGKWQMPESEFRLEVVLFVGTNGLLEGSIEWQSVRDKYLPPTFYGNEFVSGRLDQFQVEIKGYRADAGLATDFYEIVLCGSDKSGFFGGKSRARDSWNGRMEGSYLFSSGGQN